MSSGLPRPALLLRPHYVPKPWGGRKLADDLGRTDLPPGPVGESWEVADTGDVHSVVEGGPHDGAPLREVFGAPFPLLLKVLDAREPLSVQVHPDGAHDLPAKEEAWVALADGGAVAIGAFAERPLPETGAWLDAMDTLPLQGPGPSPPTMVHVPPGTVHAILENALLFEVQNPVDVTWRLDDHGRVGLDGIPRTLHLQQAQALLARAPVACASKRPSASSLVGQRFAVDLLRAGTHTFVRPGVRAAFCLGEGQVTWGSHRALTVPSARTVVLPDVACELRSSGWAILATARASSTASQ